MAYSHYTGTGLGPTQRPNGKYSNTNVHTGLKQGQGAGTIVTYCVIMVILFPILVPIPFLCSVN